MIFHDLKFSHNLLIKTLCDNKSTIYSALDLLYHGRMKHVEIDIYFIK